MALWHFLRSRPLPWLGRRDMPQFAVFHDDDPRICLDSQLPGSKRRPPYGSKRGTQGRVAGFVEFMLRHGFLPIAIVRAPEI
jgi:hypothetical protein